MRRQSAGPGYGLVGAVLQEPRRNASPPYNGRMARDAPADLAAPLAGEGFTFAPAARMRAHLGDLADWDRFAGSWNQLPRDAHLPDGHRYRRRRHATLSARAGEDTFQ